MKNYVWLSASVALVAAALVAGCGGGGSTSTPAASDAGATSATTTEASGQATPDDVYNACIDAIQGTAAEQAGQAACAQARTAFEQCTSQAQNATGSARDAALKACQTAANKTTAALKASP